MSIRYPQNSYYIDDQLLNVFQAQKQQLDKMKEQNKILNLLNDKVQKKDQEIDELQKNLRKYKKYYDDYQLIKATLSQKIKQNERLLQQNKMLFTEMNKTMAENKQLQQKLLVAQKSKHEFIKQRNASDARFRGIQQTFRQYQEECKIKQRQLIKDLEKSYNQVKQLNNKIQDFHTVKFQNEQLKAKITNLNSQQTYKSMPGSGQKVSSDFQENMLPNRNQNTSYNQMTFQSNQHQSNPKSVNNYSKSRQKSPNKSYSQVYDQDSNGEIQRLRKQLISKEVQLQRSKSLNHELSIQFDKSVSKICEFEKQLSMYRKQNHELKKTLSLFVEKQQYEKMHKHKINRNISGSEDSQEQESDQQFGGLSRDHNDSSNR